MSFACRLEQGKVKGTSPLNCPLLAPIRLLQINAISMACSQLLLLLVPAPTKERQKQQKQLVQMLSKRRVACFSASDLDCKGAGQPAGCAGSQMTGTGFH